MYVSALGMSKDTGIERYRGATHRPSGSYDRVLEYAEAQGAETAVSHVHESSTAGESRLGGHVGGMHRPPAPGLIADRTALSGGSCGTHADPCRAGDVKVGSPARAAETRGA